MDERGAHDDPRPRPATDAPVPTPTADASAPAPVPGEPPPAPPPPRRRTGLIIAVAAGAVLLLGVAAYLLLAGGGPAIETPGGRLLLEKAEITDSWPKGCTPSATDPSCLAAEPGFKVLSVAWVPEEGDRGRGVRIRGAVPGYRQLLRDRLFWRAVGGGRHVLRQRGPLGAAVRPSTSASGFTFHHPASDPIDLGV